MLPHGLAKNAGRRGSGSVLYGVVIYGFIIMGNHYHLIDIRRTETHSAAHYLSTAKKIHAPNALMRLN